VITLTLSQRRAARAHCGRRAYASIPVEVIAGGAPPAVQGEGYYWTTPSGKTIVHYPSAYRWPKWYHRSTLRVVVGEQWIAQHATMTSAVSTAPPAGEYQQVAA